MSNVILESERLSFRKIVETDADALFQILSNSDVMRYATNGPASEEGVYKFIRTTLSRYQKDGMGPWAVIEKTSQTLIGISGISVKDIDRIKEYEITCLLSRKNWGKGVGTEAASACRDYGFKVLNLDRMISIQERDNRLALKVAQKIGMTLEKEINYHHKSLLLYSINHPANT